MLFVPPKFPPLGLDLDRLDIYGSVPAQGEGRTTDGRSVDVRYRHGRLTLRLSAMDDPEPWKGEIAFDAIVGPDYDGAITTEQVCEVLGLTIRGAPVRITEDDRRGFSAKGALDLSGAVPGRVLGARPD